MSDNDTLFWRMLALFQSLPDLQPAQIVDWLAQECGETLTPARLARWRACALEARARLLAQADLVSQLLALATAG